MELGSIANLEGGLHNVPPWDFHKDGILNSSSSPPSDTKVEGGNIHEQFVKYQV